MFSLFTYEPFGCPSLFFCSCFQWAEKMINIWQVARDEDATLIVAGVPYCGMCLRFALAVLLKACRLYRPAPGSFDVYAPESSSGALVATSIANPFGMSPSSITPSPTSIPSNPPTSYASQWESDLIATRIGRNEILLRACKEVLLPSSAS